MLAGFRARAVLAALVDALEAAEAERDRLREALACEHTRILRNEDADRLWEYVEHEGNTWNRCRACGVLELWEGGMFVRAALTAGSDL